MGNPCCISAHVGKEVMLISTDAMRYKRGTFKGQYNAKPGPFGSKVAFECQSVYVTQD